MLTRVVRHVDRTGRKKIKNFGVKFPRKIVTFEKEKLNSVRIYLIWSLEKQRCPDVSRKDTGLILKGTNLQEGIPPACFILEILTFEDRRLHRPESSGTIPIVISQQYEYLIQTAATT